MDDIQKQPRTILSHHCTTDKAPKGERGEESVWKACHARFDRLERCF